MASVCVAWRDAMKRARVDVELWKHGPLLEALRRSFPCAVTARSFLYRATDDDISNVAGMVSLRHLELQSTAVTDEGLGAIATGAGALTALTWLDVDGCSELTEASMETISTGLPHLTRLIMGTNLLGPSGAGARWLGRMHGLRELIVEFGEHEPTPDDIVAMTAGLTSLTQFNLVGMRRMSAPALSAVGRLPALRTLELRSVDSVGVTPAASLQCLRGLTGLVKLSLYCDWVADTDMMALRDMTCLRELSVGESWLGGCRGLAAVMRHLPALETLDLYDVGGTKRVREALADPEVCPELSLLTDTTSSGGPYAEEVLRDGRLRLVITSVY